ncbi:MAG: DUF5320 domain-containing protein [Clostridiales bacterium]|nr:DUF5320 domain-containing protein [Clostridiales bacterium]
MPRRDGTGPMGAGAMCGRGLGPCAGDHAVNYGHGIGIGLGLGLARRRGFGRCFSFYQASSKNQKELLKEQRTILKDQLEAIDKKLENL